MNNRMKDILNVLRFKRGDHIRLVTPTESFTLKFKETKQGVTAGADTPGLGSSFGRQLHKRDIPKSASVSLLSSI